VLHIAASNNTIGSMLTQEYENDVERAIYYLGKVLNDAETMYHPSKKLCLCLYFSCINLKQYIKPIDVYVYSYFDIIRHMLLKPILHNRVGKWALALKEYSFTYQRLKSMKDQIIADFIVDHSVVEKSLNFVDVDGIKPQVHGLIGVVIKRVSFRQGVGQSNQLRVMIRRENSKFRVLKCWKRK